MRCNNKGIFDHLALHIFIHITYSILTYYTIYAKKYQFASLEKVCNKSQVLHKKVISKIRLDFIIYS